MRSGQPGGGGGGRAPIPAPSGHAWRVLEPRCAWWVRGPGGQGTCRVQWVSDGDSRCPRGLRARGLPASWFPWGLHPHGQPCPPRAPKPLGLPCTCSRPAPPYSPGCHLGLGSLRLAQAAPTGLDQPWDPSAWDRLCRQVLRKFRKGGSFSVTTASQLGSSGGGWVDT